MTNFFPGISLKSQWPYNGNNYSVYSGITDEAEEEYVEENEMIEELDEEEQVSSEEEEGETSEEEEEHKVMKLHRIEAANAFANLIARKIVNIMAGMPEITGEGRPQVLPMEMPFSEEESSEEGSSSKVSVEEFESGKMSSEEIGSGEV